MIVNDFRCPSCLFVVIDSIDKEQCCPQCQERMQVTFENWTSFNVGRDRTSLTDAAGNRNMHGALSDPLCRLKLGLEVDKHSGFNHVIPNEVKADLLNRITKDGDSAKLRETVLRTGV